MLPCVGRGALDASPTTSASLSTAFEVFSLPSASASPSSLFVVQIRGSIVPGRQRDHAARLAAFLSDLRVGRVLLLASIPSAFAPRPDRTLLVLPAERPDAEAQAQAAACAARGIDRLDPALASDRPVAERRLPPWPLLAALAARGLPALSLVAVASEGDNARDGLEMAQTAAAVAHVHADTWRAPASWAQSMY